MSKYKTQLSAYKEVEGVSLLGGSGVEEVDILQTIPKFACWCEGHKDFNIIDFFKARNVRRKVIRAFATIGIKTVIDELNKIAEKQSAADKKGQKKK